LVLSEISCLTLEIFFEFYYVGFGVCEIGFFFHGIFFGGCEFPSGAPDDVLESFIFGSFFLGKGVFH